MKTSQLAKDDPRLLGKLNAKLMLVKRGLVFYAVNDGEVLSMEKHRALMNIINARVMEVTSDAEEQRVVQWIHFYGKSIAVAPTQFVLQFLMMMTQLDADLRVVMGTTYTVKAFEEKMFSDKIAVLTEEATTGEVGISVSSF